MIPEELSGDGLLLFTNLNWGPQDTSKHIPNETQMITIEEFKSIQGFYITQMRGLFYWGVHREQCGSRSFYMAEIKLINDGIKAIRYLQHLMKQFRLPNIDYPSLLMNDNQGSID